VDIVPEWDSIQTGTGARPADSRRGEPADRPVYATVRWTKDRMVPGPESRPMLSTP
jgi:hypothetical protein